MNDLEPVQIFIEQILGMVLFVETIFYDFLLFYLEFFLIFLIFNILILKINFKI